VENWTKKEKKGVHQEKTCPSMDKRTDAGISNTQRRASKKNGGKKSKRKWEKEGESGFRVGEPQLYSHSYRGGEKRCLRRRK